MNPCKRKILVLLVLVCYASLFAGTYYYRTFDDGTCTITNLDESDSEEWDLKIPATLGEYTVTSIGDDAFSYSLYLRNIVLPEGVAFIGDYAFSGSEQLRSVTIPNSVTSIGRRVFSWCDELEEIIVKENSYAQTFFQTTEYAHLVTVDPIETIGNYTINRDFKTTTCTIIAYHGHEPDLIIPSMIGNYTVTAIGEGVFGWNLENVTIPESVTSIGEHAFTSSPYLQNIQVDENNPIYAQSQGVLFVKAEKILHTYPAGRKEATYSIPKGIERIGDGAFFNATQLEQVIIPESVTSIGEYAFNSCFSLENITIPDGVTTIGDGAFGECNSLQRIILPESVTSIGNEAFAYCSALVSINLPKRLTIIGDEAFIDCESLKSIIIPDGVTTIGDEAFKGCESLKSIIIPDGVTTIGGGTFTDCHSIRNIMIPESVTSIGDNAFDSCSALVRINLPKRLNTIADDLFKGCESLQSITIPDGVISIGDSAFYDCESIKTITLPKAIASIGDSAFLGCSHLEQIHLPENLVSIGEKAFFNCSWLENVRIPASVRTIGQWAYATCLSLEQIEVDEQNPIYTQTQGVLFNKIEKSLLAYPAGKKERTYSVPLGTTRIEAASFRQSRLEQIIIPDSVTTIGSFAFAHCAALESIILSKNLTAIEEETFLGCVSLKTITVPKSVTTIDEDAFSRCDSLQNIYVDERNPVYAQIQGVLFNKVDKSIQKYPVSRVGTSYSIPDGVAHIGIDAFNGCNMLKEILLPETITTIEKFSIFGCESLESITIPSGVSSIGHYIFNGCDKLKEIVVEEGSYAHEFFLDSEYAQLLVIQPTWL